jgi:hypothetical protein
MADLMICGNFGLSRTGALRLRLRGIGVRTTLADGLLLLGFVLTCSFLVR